MTTNTKPNNLQVAKMAFARLARRKMSNLQKAKEAMETNKTIKGLFAGTLPSRSGGTTLSANDIQKLIQSFEDHQERFRRFYIGKWDSIL